MATTVQDIAFGTPSTAYELAALLIKSAFHMPDGLRPEVRDALELAHAALVNPLGPNLKMASMAAGDALSACMANRVLDDRPETGLVYTVANLLVGAQSGKAMA